MGVDSAGGGAATSPVPSTVKASSRSMAIRPVRTISRMPNGPHLLDEGLDFVFAAGDFDHHVLGADIDDAGTKNVGDFFDFRAGAVLVLTFISIRSRST